MSPMSPTPTWRRPVSMPRAPAPDETDENMSCRPPSSGCVAAPALPRTWLREWTEVMASGIVAAAVDVIAVFSGVANSSAARSTPLAAARSFASTVGP